MSTLQKSDSIAIQLLRGIKINNSNEFNLVAIDNIGDKYIADVNTSIDFCINYIKYLEDKVRDKV